MNHSVKSYRPLATLENLLFANKRFKVSASGLRAGANLDESFGEINLISNVILASFIFKGFKRAHLHLKAIAASVMDGSVGPRDLHRANLLQLICTFVVWPQLTLSSLFRLFFRRRVWSVSSSAAELFALPAAQTAAAAAATKLAAGAAAKRTRRLW